MGETGRFERMSNASCEVYQTLVDELNSLRPELAAVLQLAPSHSLEVFSLPREEIMQRLHFTERVWEGILTGQCPKDRDVGEVMAWLAPLRSYLVTCR
eukprot:gene16065-24597_t